MTITVNMTKRNQKAQAVLADMKEAIQELKSATEEERYSVETFSDAWAFFLDFANLAEKAEKIVDVFHDGSWGDGDGVNKVTLIGSYEEYADTIDKLHTASMELRVVKDEFFAPIRPDFKV